MDMNPEKQAQKLNTGTSHHNHGLWMVICCALPLALIVGLSFFGVLGAWGYYGLILLCPAAHYFLMRNMSAKNKQRLGEKTNPTKG